MFTPEKGDRVDVHWLDADNEAGWCEHNEELDNKEEFLISTGRFVSKGPKFLTLSFSHNKSSDEWLGKHRIPVGMVVKIVKLTEEVL